MKMRWMKMKIRRKRKKKRKRNNIDSLNSINQFIGLQGRLIYKLFDLISVTVGIGC